MTQAGPHQDLIFQVTDWRGRTVRLTKRTYDNHKDKRPEFVEYLEGAKQTIIDPDLVGEGDNGASSLFRYNLGRGKYAGLWLQVVIYYRGHPQYGIMATHHFTSTLGELVMVERRYQWVAGVRFDVREVGGSR